MTFEQHFDRQYKEFKDSIVKRALKDSKKELNKRESAMLSIDLITLRVLDTIKDSYPSK